MMGGTDFVKTFRTGKISPSTDAAGGAGRARGGAATLAELTGVLVGVKVAGGVRSAKDAIRYLVVVERDGRRGVARPVAVPVSGLQSF